MKKILYNSWILLGITIIFFLLIQIPYLTDVRPVMYDEAWYGNVAYNYAIGNGFVNTIIGHGGNGNFMLPFITTGFMHIFGYNLLSIRLTAVFCGVITLLFLALAFREMKVKPAAQALTYLFFISIAIYNTIFRFGRPECAAIMCVTGGIWMYLRYQQNSSWLNMIGLSLFAYLAAVSHPFTLLFFALIGLYLLITSLKRREWIVELHLCLLIIAAIASLVSIYMLSNDEAYIATRFSIKNILQSLPIYYKEAFFSKHSLYIIPLLYVAIRSIFMRTQGKDIAIVTIVFFIIFPILFSTDLFMVGIGLDYVVLLGTILLSLFLQEFYQKKSILCVFAFYCLINLVISNYFNFKIKYEKANTVLAEDFQAIIPKGAKVFGPIRQWPMVMHTDYQSDHTYETILAQEAYDFIILNSQDSCKYPSYNDILPIDEKKMKLIYEKSTKQYGEILVYQRSME